MKSSFQPEGVTIRRLRIRGKSTDPLRDELRLSNMLSSSGVRPRALPQSAILCIRSLKDPLPGTLRLHDRQAMWSAEWENATIETMEQIAKKSSRPILGTAESNAESVLFADRAEFLACLAMDLLDGALLTHWWWKGLFHSDDISGSAVNAWLDDPEHVPAALQHLSLRGRAVPFIRSLGKSDVRASLQSLLKTFGLNEIGRILGKGANMDRGDGSFPISGSEPETTPPPSLNRAQPSLPVSSLSAPWDDRMHEVNGNDLDVDRQTLLGIGLMLQRAPGVVRSKSFARNLSNWWKAAQAAQSSIVSLRVSNEDVERVGAMLPQSRAIIAASGGGKKSTHMVDSVRASADVEKSVDATQSGTRAGESSPSVSSELVTRTREPSKQRSRWQWNAANAELQRVSDEPTSDPRPPAKVFDAARAPAGDVAQKIEKDISQLAYTEMVGLLGEKVVTKYGGVFYLINLGLLLGLYGDFTSPTRPGISLSIWDFLALFGSSLAGERIMKDPIWPLLADLADRHVDTPPGRGFRPASAWRVPPHWLDAFPEQATCRWTAGGGRLRVSHPAGFPIIDVPVRRVDILQQLEKELTPYRLSRSIRIRRGRTKELPDSKGGASQWMKWFVPYAHARLLRGLGVNRRSELRKLICLHRARIVVTPTRLDVEFQLNSLPIQVRLGGLDRDPGWVPAAGRFVSFQYK